MAGSAIHEEPSSVIGPIDRHALTIWIVRALGPVWTAVLAVWVIDAIRRVRTAVSPVWIRNTVGVIRVAVHVAMKIPLAIVQVGRIERVPVGIVERPRWLWDRRRHEPIGGHVAIVLLLRLRPVHHGADNQGARHHQFSCHLAYPPLVSGLPHSGFACYLPAPGLARPSLMKSVNRVSPLQMASSL